MLAGNSDQALRIEELETDLNEQVETNKVIQERVEQAEATAARLTEENESLVAERDGLKAGADTLKDDLWKTKGKLTKAETELAVLRQQHSK